MANQKRMTLEQVNKWINENATAESLVNKLSKDLKKLQQLTTTLSNAVVKLEASRLKSNKKPRAKKK